MRKILSCVLAAAMVISLALTASALPANRLEVSGKYGSNMPEADYHVLKTSTPPVIDGVFEGDAVWGTPIFDITGNDAYWYTTQGEYFQSLYKSWAQTSFGLWAKTDGSVELIRNSRFRCYARWDDENLYLAIVIEGTALYDAGYDEYFYAPNDDGSKCPTWFGNGIQVSFWPDDPLYSDNAGTRPVTKDDGTVVYEPIKGYVGNEYLIGIVDMDPVTCEDAVVQPLVTQGYFDDLKAVSGRNIKIPMNCAASCDLSEYQVGGNTVHGRQVYEMAIANFEMGMDADWTRATTEGIPFAVAFNIQGVDQFDESAFNGFQVGSGIFQQNKVALEDSVRMIFEAADWTMPAHEHRGGESLANCSAQAKCIVCDERYGDFGSHYYLDGVCYYCGTCEVHSFPTEEDLAANPDLDPKTCMVCGFREVSESEVLVGDLNGDGVVNSADAALMNRYAAKWDITNAVNANKENYMNFFATFADANGDGDINSADAALMNRFAAKWDLKDCLINTIVTVEVEG